MISNFPNTELTYKHIDAKYIEYPIYWIPDVLARYDCFLMQKIFRQK